MNLSKVQVTHFRSVQDSAEFGIDPVTCLVGKNEAGKSALLLALAALNPNDATPVEMDKERDYPRRDLVRYDQIHGDQQAVVVRTVWQLSESDLEAITEDVGEGVLLSPFVEVSRRYGGPLEVNAKLDYAAAVEHECSLVALNASERAMLKSPATVDDLIRALEDLENPKEKHRHLLDRLRAKGNARTRVEDAVRERLPTFMYVSAYDRMDGAIQIEETRQRIERGELDREDYRGCRLFVEFLEYAGVPINEIMSVSTYETFNARLEAASTNITDQILEYWSQNPELDVEVTIDRALPGDAPPLNSGTVARARIKNNLHRVNTPFSERSAGFIWFFSFLVKFAQVREAGGPVVLLLDEPGLSLHGKAQGDLLRFIDEKLAPSHQVIYSTHSPFMVPAGALERVRIVEDRIDETVTPRRSYGTKVSQDVLKVNADTLFPLQGALGYRATQTLFVGEHTLLVEGPSDMLYLHALSNELRQRGRTGLDGRWTMCPAGSVENIMPFVSLFAGRRLHVAVLSDEARGEKQKLRRIRESEVLQAGHFFTVADFIDSDEADIEDIFDADTFAEIVNGCYQLSGRHRVTVEGLQSDDSTRRQVKKVEAMFRVLPEEIPMFDHYTPAAWLIRNADVLSGESDALERTLSTAERVFERFNGLLPGP